MPYIKPLTIDEIYISPFRLRRVKDEKGRWIWVPNERNLHPTGQRHVDALIQSYAAGCPDAGDIAKLFGCKREDIWAMVRILTGMDIREFRHAYGFRLADDLLRYTRMSTDRIAKRSGFHSASLLCQQYLKYYKCTPAERRDKLRYGGDLNLYRL